MADNSARIQAYNSYYNHAMEEFKAGNMADAKELFIKAATVANEISINSPYMQVKSEYYQLAQKCLDAANNKCIRKETLAKAVGGGDDALATFTPVENDTEINFDKVAGLDEVKEEIKLHVIEPLLNPELANMYKIKAGSKILMYGPPGTGKTFVSRAISGEVDAVFYAVNCQDLISKYMGESSKALTSLFESAQKHERAVIFFDEFDSVASKRSDATSGADAESARFVASFLTLVDGFKKSKTNKMLLLIAATNRPWALDPAMLRGGRFDTHIYVTIPDQKAREFLVEGELEGILKAPDVDLKKLAQALDGFGGGDIVSICQKIRLEAYKNSVKSGRPQPITLADCKKIIGNTRNVITASELAKFEAFKAGKEVK